MLSDLTLDALRACLLSAEYTLDEVTRRLGAEGLGGLERNSAVPALRILRTASDPQADFIRLWLLAQPLTEATVRTLMPMVDELCEARLLTKEQGWIRALVEIKPYGDDQVSGWICSDQTPLGGTGGKPPADFVLGASPASTTLAQLVPRRPVESVLDLGTGCGIQTVHLATHCARIVATDLNPRALDLARITAGLSGIEVDFRLGSLYEPVAQERFDLIVTNPPYVISPPGHRDLVYRESELPSDELMHQVVAGAAERLNPGGTLVVLGNWAITDQPWSERLDEWIGLDCDAFVLQREVLDPYEYIELWLADAGLLGSTEYAQRYTEWLDYFDSSGITAVGMGWFVGQRNERLVPERRFEQWPHAVHQPVGEALASFFDAIAPARLTDEELRARRWLRHPELIQETLGEPGAADPQHVVLRQGYGLGRAVEPGTALAGVVGACDGELPLGVLIDAVSTLLGETGLSESEMLFTQVRRLISDGYLVEA